MIIGIPKETKIHEYRVSMTPDAVADLCAHGHVCYVQQSAGVAAGFSDRDYQQAGAHIATTREEVFLLAQLIVKVKEPHKEEIALLRPEHILFTFLHLAAVPDIAALLLASGCTAIAYETVTDDKGRLPLLMPMSMVAGRMAIQAAARCLEQEYGGKGLLMSGIRDVPAAKVIIIGAGTVGRNAAMVAIGMGADVIVIDKQAASLQAIKKEYGERIETVLYSPENLMTYLAQADVIVGAALQAGKRAPKILTRQHLKTLQHGTVLVDVSIDQGGCFESSRPTTHADPSYIEEGIVHYCVTNMPGAVPRTSTMALSQTTLPYILRLANKGVADAMNDKYGLVDGINIHAGKIYHEAVASALQQVKTKGA
ncbi:MAG: alanine dehydrogenase [Kordiimonas sp.]|nr:alanine dehydrogenase [Kordiimonas sp.]